MHLGTDSWLMHGDCLEVLQDLPAESYDSLVTDPPAGIGFMGKEWDHHKGGRDQWVAWMTDVMRECHRVLKPGAHGLVWALPRTSHWTAMALEDAGFEIRDSVHHIFGSGFPKSMDVSKAIDKAAGVEREVTGSRVADDIRSGNMHASNRGVRHVIELKDKPATPEAKQWSGFGTALKPAHEVWWLVRKPLGEKTVAKNVLKHGTGALNIDASRVEGVPESGSGAHVNRGVYGKYNAPPPAERVQSTNGRFPSNQIVSGKARDVLDEQSGVSKSAGGGMNRDGNGGNNVYAKQQGHAKVKNVGHGDTGGASRFFFDGADRHAEGCEPSPQVFPNGYTDAQCGDGRGFIYAAKPSKRERNEGCDGMEEKQSPNTMASGSVQKKGEGNRLDGKPLSKNSNHHPTVKAQKLMRYLTRMVTPPGGTVLDPFMGSGSTGVACAREGFKFVGIEAEKEYLEIARARIESVEPSFL